MPQAFDVLSKGSFMLSIKYGYRYGKREDMGGLKSVKQKCVIEKNWRGSPLQITLGLFEKL